MRWPSSSSHCQVRGRLLSGRHPVLLVALLLLTLIAVNLISVSAADAAPAADQTIYVVRAGDTLARISARYGVSITALVNANGIANPNHIFIGQRLIIPGVSSPSSGSGSGASPAPVTGSIYIVQPGDTLSRIAVRYKTTVAALLTANGLTNPDRIWIGQRLRIGGGAAPAPVPQASGERWIDVDLSSQTLTAYQGNAAVFSALISSGLPGTPTVVGRYQIYTKLTSTRMSGPGYDLPNVPYTMYFYRGYAIHGTYWHNNFGSPMSHGCVNMKTQDAAWVFNWASIGTPVVTHW